MDKEDILITAEIFRMLMRAGYTLANKSKLTEEEREKIRQEEIDKLEKNDPMYFPDAKERSK